MKISGVIFLPFRLLNQLEGYLWGTGSWSLRPYERKLIDVAAEKLSPKNRATLDEQLNSWFYVQRFHKDRMTNIHFQWKDSIRKMNLPDNYRLAKVKIKHGRSTVSVSVEAHYGLIFGLHYYKPPKPIVLGDFIIDHVDYGGKGDESITRSIDREEHGDEFE